MPVHSAAGIVTLELSGITLLDGIPLHLFPGLQHLEVYNCGGWDAEQDPLNLSLVPAMKYMKFDEASNITALDLSPLQHLQHFSFCDMRDGLRQLDLGLPDGQPRTALQHLDISGNYQLTSLDLTPVPGLLHLACNATGISGDSLDLSPCSQFSSLELRGSDMSHLDLTPWAATLKQLDIGLCENLSESGLVGLTRCSGLQQFRWQGCPAPGLDLRPLTQLQELNGAQNLETLDCLPPSIENLSCKDSPRMSYLDFWHLTSLSSLNLSGTAVPYFVLPIPFGSLAELHLANSHISHLDLRDATNLQQLDVSDSPSLLSMHLPPSLQQLSAEGCSSLEQLNLRPLTQLVRLELSDAVVERLDLSSCAQLTALSIPGCHAIRARSTLRYCTALQTLKVMGCDHIHSVHACACKALATVHCSMPVHLAPRKQ